jgi:prepilin-type processing-associated H-X9-DG protein
MSNLREIYNATRMYANQFRDKFPGPYATGGYGCRRLPGELTPNDPAARPEVYGLPALYQQLGFLRGDNVWKCPSASELVQSFGNTYAWSIATVLDRYTSRHRGNTIASNGAGQPVNRTMEFFVWDNWSLMPFTTGARRGAGDGSPTIPPASRAYPHQHATPTKRERVVNMLYLDGHVGAVYYQPTGGTVNLD